MAVEIVPPLINAQLNYLLQNSPYSIKVEQMWSGARGSGLFDRFTLAIPFCLESVKWDIIYNAQYPQLAPDVVFGPDDEGFHPFHGTGEVEQKLEKNSLTDWNSKDPTRLLTLILELRDLYMAHHKQRAGKVDDERLKFEISTVVSKEGIEMLMCTTFDKSEEVKFAVPLLDMDINNMVFGTGWRHQQKIYLQVIYPVGKKYLPTPLPRLKLVSSPELKALFLVEDFRLPPWLSEMCLAEYLPTLEEMLSLQIREAVSSIEIRRQFIVTLASLFGRPVEADPVFCRKASFLASSGVFVFLVHVSIPLQFPKQQPALLLQSSQHFNSLGVPIKSAPLTDYRWSPRWEPSEMAERVFDLLSDECLSFKKNCNDGVLH